MINLPIYRAFSETFDKYILGVPYFSDGRYYMLVDDCNKNNNVGSGSYPVDETTLAIHFPNMLDRKGNKIFASLQEDDKGGDILFDMEYEYTLSFDGLKFNLQGLCSQSSLNKYDSWKDFNIIGIER